MKLCRAQGSFSVVRSAPLLGALMAVSALSGACRSGDASNAAATSSSGSATNPAASTASTSGIATQGYKTYGAPIEAGPSVPLSEISANPESFAAQRVIVEGEVRRACTRKGCWMEIGSQGQADGPRCRVTFKDYAFFVPTNSAGAQARIQGTPVVKVVPAEHVAHLESEGAHFERKRPDGSAEELSFVATGVELKKPAG